MKLCNRCNVEQPRTAFNKARSCKDGLRGQCKTCQNAYSSDHYTANKETRKKQQKAWAASNGDNLKAAGKRYRDNNPDRQATIMGRQNARMRGAEVSDMYDFEKALWFYAEARKRTAETGYDWEVDHILPIARGGLHCHTNLQVLTKAANRSKGAGQF